MVMVGERMKLNLLNLWIDVLKDNKSYKLYFLS